MTSTEAAAVALQDHAALWSMGEIRAHDVVHAACDALVAGLDTPGLRILAACTRAEADYDVHDLLPAALAELDDEYDTLEYGDRALDQVDAEVTTEARRLAAHSTVPEPTDPPS
ncbi:hypothetical protein [Streptomyces adustus]|uniref:hypothetical protein n=1 Tax=Streptomyces adustus TaxID=1609272 RepID=UPI00371CE854